MIPRIDRANVEAVFRQVLGAEFNSENVQLQLQSLKMLELVVALENEFSVTIPEDAPIAKITASVASVVEYLKRFES